MINVSPLWTLQCLSSGPDQMLRQRALTAKRTMTRAGDVNGLDEGAAIRERPPSCKGVCNVACRSLAVMYPASDTVRDRTPRWNPLIDGIGRVVLAGLDIRTNKLRRD